MIIRTAVTQDARAIAQIHVLSWQHAYRDILPNDFLASLSVERRQAYWNKTILNGSPQVLVADDNGETVGFSAFGPCRDDDATAADYEIWALYLTPDCWSRGVGRRLWLRSRDTLSELGAARVSLWVIAGNKRAMRFYRAAGFEPEPESRQPFELGGITLDEIRYAQRLD